MVKNKDYTIFSAVIIVFYLISFGSWWWMQEKVNKLKEDNEIDKKVLNQSIRNSLEKIKMLEDIVQEQSCCKELAKMKLDIEYGK